jgi:hypothetical protein
MLVVDGVGAAEPFHTLLPEVAGLGDPPAADALTGAVYALRADAYHRLAEWRRHEATVVVVRGELGSDPVRAVAHRVPPRRRLQLV